MAINDRDAAAAFGSARTRRILFALMAKEHSLSELAEATGSRLNLLHHHVGRLVRLGLVRMTGVRRRAGAPIKLYRASASAFFVPAELIGYPTEDMHASLRESLETSFAMACVGVEYRHDGTNAQFRLVRDPDFTARSSEIWGEIELNQADAAALAEELRSLLKRYAGRQGGGRRFVFHAALAPV